MMRNLVSKFHRQIIAGMLIFSMLMPNVASAQLVTTDPALLAQTVAGYISSTLKVLFKNVVVAGAINVSQTVARQAAESIATWVASGGQGKNPLAYMKSPGDYIVDQGKAALSSTLDQMSKDLANANLLCVPNPLAGLGVVVGIYDALNKSAHKAPFNAPVTGAATETLGSSCDAGSIAISYKSLTNELSSEQLLGKFTTALTSGSTEFDGVIKSQMNAMTSIIAEQQRAQNERLATKSHMDMTTPISKVVVEPASSVEADSKVNTASFQQQQESQTLSGILASGAESIPAIFATTLLNSLSKKLIDRLKQGKGTLPESKEFNLANIFGSGNGGKTTASGAGGAIYADTKVINISEGDLDLLSNFTSCPDKFTSPENCVLDGDFAAAVRVADAGKPISVQEALDQGKLHGDWQMIPPTDTAHNEDSFCYKSAYCYSNLTKLRKARIISVGWEIAAATAGTANHVLLKDVVAGFYKCNDQGGLDADHPYCHLIDPNWILKIPAEICRAQVYGPQPESSISVNRQQICADEASCLQEDESGQCTGQYGYCLRERNTFRFNIDQCPAQFAGCRTFANGQYGDVSLIESTLDPSSCSAKNSGCLGFYSDYNQQGAFDTTQSKVYLTDKAISCEAQYAGCTEVQNSDTGVQNYLRLPPAGLGCKGLSTDPTECGNYAKACTVDEVGCEVYQPTGSSDASVPGIATFATRDTSGGVVAWNDECASECVGYASYYQAPTQTEPLQSSSAAFIPASSQQCSQDVVGCDTYTNIDSTEKGGGDTKYFANIQKCITNDGNNHGLFYSWEGSDKTGYQLHQHDLQVDADTTPHYDYVDSTELASFNAACSKTIYEGRILNGQPNPAFNSDCRELFDKNGIASYRLLSKTIIASASCTQFRKLASDQNNCVASHGTFDATTGACEYGILPSGSQSCKKADSGCRAFNGAAALSPKIVMNESFVGIDGWLGGTISNEGITVGDTVLKIVDANAHHSVSVLKGKTYDIVFWAKGTGGVNVSFFSSSQTPNTVQLNADAVTVSPEWRRFEVSTAVNPWSDGAANLIFQPVGNAPNIFIDNIVVKEQADVVYVVKNSWKTPLTCDPTPNDSIPGPALNCHQYTPQSTSGATEVYLTGFTGLCRAEVAGCKQFVNTQNTAQVTPLTVSFGAVSKIVPADKFVYVVANSAASCPADKKGCSALGIVTKGALETTFRINNPDNYSATSCKQEEEWCQTFTTSDQQQRFFKYPAADKQCEYRDGVDKSGVTYSGWFKSGTDQPCYASFVSGGNYYGIYKNQDAAYTGVVGLCTPTYDQCTEFIDHADKLEGVKGGRSYYFLKNSRLDTTSCGGQVGLKAGCVALDDTSKSARDKATMLSYCKSDPTIDPDCPAMLSYAQVAAADIRTDGGLVTPVADTTALPATDYYGVCKEANSIGLFTATDCDTQLTKYNAACQNSGSGWCGPIAGNCLSNSVQTQLATNFNNLKKICSGFADANTIVKVQPDRTCDQWLACQSSISEFDPATQKYKQVCTDLGVCDKSSTDANTIGQCANWVTKSHTVPTTEDITNAMPLSTNNYVDRNIGWYGNEYSGYSLWNKFQPDAIGWFSPDGTQGKLVVGAGFVATKYKWYSQTSFAGCTQLSHDGKFCIADVFNSKEAGDMIVSSFGSGIGSGGICQKSKCWYPLDGFRTDIAANALTSTGFVESSCRGYPEQDSPFPQEVGIRSGKLSFGAPESTVPGFERVNICAPYRSVVLKYTGGSTSGKNTWTSFSDFLKIQGFSDLDPASVPNGSCECSYTKVVYGQGNTTHYYDTANSPIKPGVCDGGWYVAGDKEGQVAKPNLAVSKKGLSCSSNFDCIDERVLKIKDITAGATTDATAVGSDASYHYSPEDGTCQFKTKETKVMGWEGYCLEQDFRTHLNGNNNERACQTWLPIDVGSTDLYNQYSSAGFSVGPLGQGRMYCLATSGKGKADAAGKLSFSYALPELKYSVLADAPVNYSTELGAAQLPVDTHSSDIDSIEIEATAENSFFPQGYKMIIKDDGVIRSYVNGGWVDETKKTEPLAGSVTGDCLVREPKDAGSNQYFDFLDPSALSGIQSDVLKTLSKAVRVGNNYFGGNGDVDVKKYFSCSRGEQNTAQAASLNGIDEPAAQAVTGVIKHTEIVDNDEIETLLSNFDMGGNPQAPPYANQVWFLRIVNHNYQNSPFQSALFYNGMLIHDFVGLNGTDFIQKSMGPSGGDCTDLGAGSAGMAFRGNERVYELNLIIKSGLVSAPELVAGSCDGTAIFGGTNPIKAGWKFKINLTDRCTEAVQTDLNGQNAAQTNNLWQAPNKNTNHEMGLALNENGIILPAQGSDAFIPFASQYFGSVITAQQTPFDLVYVGKERVDIPSVGARAYSCEYGPGLCLGAENGNAAAKISFTTGVSALHQLFARFYAYSGSAENTPGLTMDTTATGISAPPTVYALDADSCTGVQSGTCRVARKNDMTINGKNGDTAVVAGQGSVGATLKFYGSADRNHLPIQRVTIDWGDAGGAAVSKQGLFRNHKPICSTPTEPATACTFAGVVDYNTTCATDKDCVNSAGVVTGSCAPTPNAKKWSFGSWGGDGINDAGACEQGYFQFAHAYRYTSDCGGKSLASSTGVAVEATGPLISQFHLQNIVNIGEKFCAFKPKVQLMDNWGICNGVDANGNAVGYWADSSADSTKCDLTKNGNAASPFQGYIIVKE
ncbi:MAG: hypothetical protein NT003_02850 [Candidatus Magasanikbacteria bacterium]|nr:hypothetical protein [Candidatus Magasanikbacteria bacterium]